ncbi:uncharacterized protein AMSG_05605 [Thecamonas trahens ATCC 50062]|uniref:Rab-GAP TBC domain-containing protein n=1 Tax=Thecamonas trahens ATCC 50062 TaxID=461836 RepID=A0A0L0DB65_THETB|nr:hypothetical protein AMSG_05605 [Thecamonas trahens ATCC 50062]KNC49569.1 hypothetical protein AMSG_05605 [Thecamonas trahens ATCC 50062]|eukprot:XP_013757678.1 hypothetical protein AMSG_05605 [Thecamonas trahens ATCC 50062]
MDDEEIELGVSSELVAVDDDDALPANVHPDAARSCSWVEAMAEETLLPGTGWYGVQQRVAPALDSALAGHLVQEQARQVALSLAGRAWRTAHARHLRFMPTLLEPPFMAHSVRSGLADAITADVLGALHTHRIGALYASAGRGGLIDDSRVAAGENAADAAAAVATYRDSVQRILVAGIDREWGRRLAAADAAADGDDDDDDEWQLDGLGELSRTHGVPLSRDEWEDRKSVHSARLRARILELQDELRIPSARDTAADDAAADDALADNDELVARVSELTQARSAQTKYEVLGEVLAALFARRASLNARLNAIPGPAETQAFSRGKLTELVGTSLPASFRQHLWAAAVPDADRASDEVARPGLARPGLARRNKRTLTPNIDALMRKAVTDIYDAELAELLPVPPDEPPPQPAASTGPLRETYLTRTCDVVNQLYVDGQEYTARFVLLAYPVITIFPHVDAPRNLARMVLEINRKSALSEAELAAHAAKAFALLENLDPMVFLHLKDVYNRRTFGASSASSSAISLMTASSAAALVRPWLEASFIGFLPHDMLLFVWDQLLLVGFHLYPLLTAALLAALKPLLLPATAPEAVVDVITRGLHSVFTVDVQQAFLKLYQDAYL